MKQSEIKELSTVELIERIETEKKQLLKMKLNHAVSPLENPMKISLYRRNISRMLTEVRAREIAEQNKK